MITCAFEDGGTATLRHVTVGGIIIKDGRVLLGKRGTRNGKKMLESGKWGLLGGFMERDETLEQALAREVKEESGYEIENLKLLRVNSNPDRPAEDRQNVDVIFVVDAKEKHGQSDEEVTHLQWFSLNDLPPKEMIAFDHADSLEMYKLQTSQN